MLIRDVSMTKMRIEKDGIGELEVPENVYWGINTQRAIQNFQLSGRRMPLKFIKAVAQVKKACLEINSQEGLLDDEIIPAMKQSIDEIVDGMHQDQFPIDVFQTGSGTQTNMNLNEVIANRANEILGHPMGKKYPVHPNDHVNRSQSSNDVIPTAMHVAAVQEITDQLIPAIEKTIQTLSQKIKEFKGIVKIGRTHLQDAVPIPLSLEFQVYLKEFEKSMETIKSNLNELYELPIGGTALGTGLNAPPDFSKRVSQELAKITNHPFCAKEIQAEEIASHLVFVKTSGTLRAIALAALKMANDIRWMASGPRAGLGELILPENEPGSSIMPGKINPTQSEALIQITIYVMGLDSSIANAEGFGSILDLNVTKPLIIVNILEMIKLLSSGLHSFCNHALTGLKPNLENISHQLERSLMIVTRLTPAIGYDKATEVAHEALESGTTIREALKRMNIEIDNLDDILDPKNMV
jgi:fumarate hydratase class II